MKRSKCIDDEEHRGCRTTMIRKSTNEEEQINRNKTGNVDQRQGNDPESVY